MKPIHDFYDFNYNKTKYRFLPTGDIFDFTYDNIMMNQFYSNPKDGSASNIYLRIYKEGAITSYPLLGVRSNSSLKKGKNTLVSYGIAEGITYEVTFRGTDKLWFWEIELSGKGEIVDLLYGQDIGNASIKNVLTNELYTAQYLGHNILPTEDGYVVCSRQNQDQEGNFPYVQQGTLGIKAIHYSTDGFQFFGTSYKATDRPEILSKDLPDVNYQFEFSYIGLQTEKLCLDSSKKALFYGLFQENHEAAVSEIEDLDTIRECYYKLPVEEELVSCDKIKVKDIFGETYSSIALKKEEIYELFPNHILEEQEGDVLLSFFTDDHSHIVTMQKELMTERPHGTIITTCIDTKKVNSNLITSTNYMMGIFQGQTAIGNTSFHKFLSAPRGLLNIQKNCGQHLYVKMDGKYRLLTMPALYEMGMNYSKWYYVLPEDRIIITSFTVAQDTKVILEVASQKKIAYDFILTNQLVLGEFEFTEEVHAIEIQQGLRFDIDCVEYPGLHYDLQIPEVPYAISDDRIFFTDDAPKDETFLTISLSGQSYFQCIISGHLQEAPASISSYFSFEKESNLYFDFYQQLNRNFYLKSPQESLQTQLEILNQTAWWYSHNAMVHFADPHGLEQPGGAAWGTRDVCQGPMEYFLATQNYELAGKILLNIFAHQNRGTGEWPQWFMFDRYQKDAGECHGDVVFWPLKSIGDYMKCSSDYSLLQEMIPYAEGEERKETLLQHIKVAFSAIQKRFIKNSGLLTYAGGDWDDTLQPADPSMKEHLISSWTVALAYQTLNSLSQLIRPVDKDFSALLSERASIIRRDFSSLLIQDGVIAGFARQEKEGFTYILHPSDKETDISYRLIPMTRSIIAELVEPFQANNNMDIIHRELKFPDGVRLMNKPAHYNGGISKLFKRAEQAANVGREISLQYTHAHIRYIEACAKLGDAESAWEGLFIVNPIQIQQAVPSASRRQSNMYFSSSDGFYMDRYDYTENFNRLKEGTIPVKGGWRLYSSGPGIYLNQLISNILGIRFSGDYLIIDPVLPYGLNGMEFTYTCFDQRLTFRYHLGQDTTRSAKCDETVLPSEELFNPYRKGGIQIHKKELENVTPVIDII